MSTDLYKLGAGSARPLFDPAACGRGNKRHLVHAWNINGDFDYSPVFYIAVNKYGWNAFRLLILETRAGTALISVRRSRAETTDLVDSSNK
jgi:hypothetical protein